MNSTNVRPVELERINNTALAKKLHRFSDYLSS